MIQVTRRIAQREGEAKIEKRRREVAAQDVGFFTRIYKKL